MRVLIIGGTRFIGPPVVAELQQSGHKVTLFHRGQTDAATQDVSEILGDRRKLTEYTKELRKLQLDVVLDMVAVIEEDARQLSEVFTGSAKRVVLVSSMDVYRAYGRLLGKEQGPPDETPLTEESPLREKLYPYREEQLRSDKDEFRIRDEYDKIPIEHIVMNNDELPGTVLRLPMVYGPSDYQHRLFPYLKRMDDKRPAIILDESIAHWRSSRGFVEDIARGITLAVTDERATDNVYNVCERTALEEIDFVKLIGESAGWDGEIVVRKSEELPEALRDEHATEHHLDVSSEKIRRELGYKEVTAREEAMRTTVEWERANPPSFKSEDFDYALEDQVLAVKK